MKKYLLLFLCALSSQMLTAKTVGPLIQTKWDQGDPYNLMCPEKDGQHCLVSCGATAEAQLLYYHRWPEHGMGTGYYHVAGEDFVFVDLTNDYYEYDKMLLTYDANSSEEAKKAVALLMRDVAYTGVVFDLGESMSPSEGYLAELLGYDYGLMHLEDGYATKDDFKTIIRAELDAGRPVLVGGSNGSGGHAFICDGYRDNDEFHFNYGWSGNSDGWSTLEGCLFPINMTISYNIKKDEGGEPGFTLGSNKDFRWMGGNKLYGNYKFDSFFKHELQPQIALAVENTETHEIQYLYSYDMEPGDPNDVELTWELDADLPDGSYILYPVGRGKLRNTQWQKAYFREQCQREVALTVKGGVKTFDNATIIDPVREGAVEVDGLCYELDNAAGTATLTYRNEKYISYFGDIVIPDAITIGGKSYRVTAVGPAAFRECESLGNVTIGKNVTIIGWGAFDMAAAGDVTFAEGSQLNLIDQFGFYNASFNNIVLPEGLQTISVSAFSNSNIKSITIPSTVTEFGYHCFGTTSLVSVHVNSSTPQAIPDVFRENVNGEDFVEYNDWIAYGTQASVLYVPAGTKDAYAKADIWKNFGFILEPDDDDSFVASINRDAIEVDGIIYQFNGVKSIARAARVKDGTKNVIVNSFTLGGKTFDVTSIGREFLNITQYDEVVIPASVETVEYRAFQGTIGELIFEEGSHLKTVQEWGFQDATINSPLVLPEGLETLDHFNIYVSDITIPSTVTKMMDGNLLYNVEHCRVSWPTPLVVSGNLFDPYIDYSHATLHVPEGTKALYEAAEGWKRFGTIVEDGGKSAIQAVSTAQTDNGAWYTLTGSRLNTQPTKSGLYIHNGKKVMIK